LPVETDRKGEKIKIVNYLTEIRTRHKSEALPRKLSFSITYHLNITT